MWCFSCAVSSVCVCDVLPHMVFVSSVVFVSVLSVSDYRVSAMCDAWCQYEVGGCVCLGCIHYSVLCFPHRLCVPVPFNVYCAAASQRVPGCYYNVWLCQCCAGCVVVPMP